MIRRSVVAFGAAAFVASALIVSSTSARVGSAPTTASVVSVKPVVMANELPHTLKQARLNTVVVWTGLAFKVGVRNAGGSQAKGVPVTFALNGTAGGYSKIVTVGSIAPGKTTTITFDRFGRLPLAKRMNLVVAVANGRTLVYPIIFSLPG